MADDLRAMGGMHRDEIEVRLAEIARDHKRIADIVCGNGRPGLEEKIMGRVIELMRHEKGNWQQGDVDLEELVTIEKQERLTQHRENLDVQKEHTKALARLERFAYCAGAVFMVLKFFGVENILKMLKP